MEASTHVTLSSAIVSNSRSTRKTADTDLKSSIIEFMRGRPFLWNSKHPNYKDHKRREQEFQSFSGQIGHPVQEIKRVWHVLRTNFFRAHKLLSERPQSSGENGEKLWKYYLAMAYILEGSVMEDSKDVRQTRSLKVSKDIRGAKSKELNNNIKNYCGSTSRTNCNQINTSNTTNNSIITNDKSTILNDSSIDADDDHLYARSLTSTLRRFDPMTREIIKLKFQEIIVSYMKQKDVSQDSAACSPPSESQS